MGLAAGGVGGMKLRKGISIIYAAPVDAQGELLTITTHGYAKRSSLSEYSSQGRNGGGIVTHKTTSRTGNVTAALLIPSAPPEGVIVLPRKGGAKSVALEEIPVMGRGVQGKQIVDLGDGTTVVALRAVTSSYQVAVENRIVVEEEVGAVAQGPVKKANPFSTKATSTEPANRATGKESAPAGNGQAPTKPVRAAKAPSAPRTAATSRKATPHVADEAIAPVVEKGKASARRTQVEAAPEPAPARRRRSDTLALPPEKAKSTPAKPAKAKAAAKPVAATNGSANGNHAKATPTVTAERAGDKQKVKPTRAEATARHAAQQRASSVTPANETQGKAKAQKPAAKPEHDPQENDQRRVVKAKEGKAKPKEVQPQQPSLLTVEKTPPAKPVVPPRREQKLAAVTSVKRPKK
jgi:hypothetical protein